MRPTGSKTGTSIHAIRAVERVMSDGQPRDFCEIVEAIQDLAQSKTAVSVGHSLIPTRDEIGSIGKKLGFTVKRQTRYIDGIVDGVRVQFPKQVRVYQMK